MKILIKRLMLTLVIASMPHLHADSGKGKIRTAVYDVKHGKTISFKARPNLSNNQFYNLVAKKTGIAHEELIIRGVRDTRDRHLSADKLNKFRAKPPRVTQTFRTKLIGRATRMVTKPVEPLADVTVVPVADVADDLLLLGVYRD